MNALDRSFFHHLFVNVAEEMGSTLMRTAFSPNITERKDFSCAVFTGGGQLLAQAAHIPVHLGALPRSMQAIFGRFTDFEPGDCFILNDPFAGGTHLPDITLATPVFHETEVVFWLLTRAHHADVGGMSPGSLPLSREIVQEGFRFPPLRLRKAGVLNEELLAVFLANVRTPAEREGDLRAQEAAHAAGERRLLALLDKYGLDQTAGAATALLDYGEAMVSDLIKSIPDGVYLAEDALEDDGLGNGPFPIQVKLTIDGAKAQVDFDGSAACCPGSLNAVEAITASAVTYCFLCLLYSDGDQPPVNGGCFRPIEILAPAGTIVNASPPHAVAAGNVETSQRIVDTVFAALAQAIPESVPAASQGTMNNLTIGGQTVEGLPFAYYETIAGGLGARPGIDGLDAVQVHMTNTLNTPIEALERAFPFRLQRYEIAENTGGTGTHRGGHGLIREYEFLAPVTVTLLTSRRTSGPYGLAGGTPGQPGKNEVLRQNEHGAASELNLDSREGGKWETIPGKATLHLKPGERLRMTTPGGGGWGKG